MMGLIEAELGNALTAPVRRKHNNTRNLRLTANRVATNATEVMVKITGFGKGAGHVMAHLQYISRHGKLELETDRGELLEGKEDVKAFFKDWKQGFSDSKRHKNQRDTMHMVLSMPESTDPESVRQAVRAFTQATFGNNHEYVFALHTDEPHPHCHVTVKCLGYDGRRLNPRKADLQAWREGFADKLRDQGIDAEATPRRSRGVVKKPEPNVIRHIERGDKTHLPRVSRVRAAKIKEAVEELESEAKGLSIPAKPWETAIQTRQQTIRKAWSSVAAALEQQGLGLTFNQKEPKNERVRYDSISEQHARSGQRAAAVYQSGIAEPGRAASPGSLAGMRNLPGLGMVHHARPAQMLLQSYASDRLGSVRETDSSVRWPGVGHSGAAVGKGLLNGQGGQAVDNQTLASRIRAFLNAMPGSDTERHQLKRQLVKTFSRTVEKTSQPDGSVLRPLAPDCGKNADLER